MNPEAIKKLTEAARGDAQLFHALIFNPESVLSKLDYLDRETKGRIISINPESFIEDFLGELASDCTVTVNCTSTCTHTVSKDFTDFINPVINPAIGKRR